MVPVFPLFVGVLAFFHLSEYALVFLFNRADLSKRSWLISKPYCTAMAAACIEYFLERRFAPWIKLPLVSWLGLAAVVAGELLRKTAMITARHNFTHMVQTSKRPEHMLVTRGVYAWVRHPGYSGWMLWAVGTQLLLCNPLCTAGFAAAAWKFFHARIAAEEHYLLGFFGAEYRRYHEMVPSGVPWVP